MYKHIIANDVFKISDVFMNLNKYVKSFKKFLLFWLAL